MEEKYGIKYDGNGISCFKVTIIHFDQKVDVVCPWSAELLFNQVVNVLNAGNSCIIDVCSLLLGGNKK